MKERPPTVLRDKLRHSRPSSPRAKRSASAIVQTVPESFQALAQQQRVPVENMAAVDRKKHEMHTQLQHKVDELSALLVGWERDHVLERGQDPVAAATPISVLFQNSRSRSSLGEPLAPAPNAASNLDLDAFLRTLSPAAAPVPTARSLAPHMRDAPDSRFHSNSHHPPPRVTHPPMPSLAVHMHTRPPSSAAPSHVHVTADSSAAHSTLPSILPSTFPSDSTSTASLTSTATDDASEHVPPSHAPTPAWRTAPAPEHAPLMSMRRATSSKRLLLASSSSSSLLSPHLSPQLSSLRHMAAAAAAPPSSIPPSFSLSHNRAEQHQARSHSSQPRSHIQAPSSRSSVDAWSKRALTALGSGPGPYAMQMRSRSPVATPASDAHVVRELTRELAIAHERVRILEDEVEYWKARSLNI